MICTKCHQDNVEEANYCKKCGTLYSHRHQYLEEIDSYVKRNEKIKRFTLIMMILCGIIYVLTEIL